MKLTNKDFENLYTEILIEFLLEQREKRTLKNWGHIWGQSSIHAYVRWSKKIFHLPIPKEFSRRTKIFGMPVKLYHVSFTKEQIEYIQKFFLFDQKKIFSQILNESDKKVFPLLSLIGEWYQSGFSKQILLKSPLEHYLYYFLLAISDDFDISYDYYFRFTNRLQNEDFENLKKSYLLNQNFLFTNIALSSYLFQNQYLVEAELFFENALKIDKKNPYLLCKYSNLLLSYGTLQSYKKAEKIIERVAHDTHYAAWTIQYYAQVKNALCKFDQTIHIVSQYYEKKKGLYQTFEPYLFRAFAYINIGNFPACKRDLEKIEVYYFGEGYRFLYEKIYENLAKIYPKG